jgi:ABC-type glutathione transport system ATPase component
MNAVQSNERISIGSRAEQPAVIEVADLRKHYVVGPARLTFGKPRVIRALDGVSFRLQRGRTLSLVGESGSGKTTTARLILGLDKPTGGSIRVAGRPVGARENQGSIQAVFQDPATSLDPRMRVGAIVEEPLRRGSLVSKREWREKVVRVLDHVGLGSTAYNKYPHAFSGGQQQRIAIARALVSDPQVVVLDEPVSSLDVSIRAQIINLLIRLQQEYGTAYLFISHDLASVRALSDDVAVMLAGRIVEQGPATSIFGAPREPYTRALLAASYFGEDQFDG